MKKNDQWFQLTLKVVQDREELGYISPETRREYEAFKRRIARGKIDGENKGVKFRRVRSGYISGGAG